MLPVVSATWQLMLLFLRFYPANYCSVGLNITFSANLHLVLSFISGASNYDGGDLSEPFRLRVFRTHVVPTSFNFIPQDYTIFL